MGELKNESFVRWQGRTVDQLSFVNNLFVGLSTGMLIFLIQFAFSHNGRFVNIEKWLNVCSIVLIFFSLFTGGLLAINRLYSFRLTSEIARNRESNGREGIEEKRSLAKKRDRRTWILLWTQIISFILGGLLLLIISVMRYLS